MLQNKIRDHITSLSSEDARRKVRAEDIRLFLTLFLTVVSFVVCWLPLGITGVVLIFVPENELPAYFHCAPPMILLNLLADPIIFISCLKNIREEFFKTLKSCMCCCYCCCCKKTSAVTQPPPKNAQLTGQSSTATTSA